MTDRRLLIPEFGRLLINISSTSQNSDDEFLVGLTSQELIVLFGIFFDFVSNRSLSAGVLETELMRINDMFDLFFDFEKITHLQFLTTQRDILQFKKSLMDYPQVSVKKEKSMSLVLPKQDPGQINGLKKKILGFINKEGETLNLDVFNQFKDVSKRTLKRHLSELISGGYIGRESQGKKVYYRDKS